METVTITLERYEKLRTLEERLEFEIKEKEKVILRLAKQLALLGKIVRFQELQKFSVSSETMFSLAKKEGYELKLQHMANLELDDKNVVRHKQPDEWYYLEKL